MFHEASYRSHARGFAADLVDPERKRIAASWFDETTADAWRHARGYEIASYLGGVSGEYWFTVGDGRFGLDAIRLRRRGVSNILATDIDESLLQASKNQGLLSEYRVENAERLSFADASFDYAFCKEAYHHFPRPMIALYEMLRVARKGVILVEPNDRTNTRIVRFKSVIKRLLGRSIKHRDTGAYESDGNYVFSISEREIEKVALGIDLPQVAFKGFNDSYVPGQEFEIADATKSVMYRKMRRNIAFRDFLCWLGLDQPALLMACLFREPLRKDQRDRMNENGWKIVDLPRNPYISAA